LLGIRLAAAEAASSRIALLLSSPTTLKGYALPPGAKAHAESGTPPPQFETTTAIDVVPAQPVLFVSTKNPFVYDLLRRADGSMETPSNLPTQVPANDTEWLTVTWDGKTPKLKDMPLDPVRDRGRDVQQYLWIALETNLAPDAGFRGVRVTLTVQLDDDEVPDARADIRCDPTLATGDAPPPVDWLAYYDVAAADTLQIPGRVDDTTAQLTRSGVMRFTIPSTVGPIPASAWKDLRAAISPTPLEACKSMVSTMGDSLSQFTVGTLSAANYKTVVTDGLSALKTATQSGPPIAHPLDPGLRSPAKATTWLRIALPDPTADGASRIRMLSFNVADVDNATTVTNELLGRGNGRAGQRFSLAHQNVLAGTLDLAVQESITATDPLIEWTELDSLDAADPFARVFVLDREAGVIQTGDAVHGRIVPLVPNTGDVIALRYRYGGGVSGNLAAGKITKIDSAPGVSDVVNFVPADGGRDAETQDAAEIRARHQLSSQDRAVTAADFQWIASQTPDVRVARVEVVPLRRPLAGAIAVAPVGSTPTPTPAGLTAPRCAPPVPAGPIGLSPAVTPGAVTVIAVPQAPGPEPVPTRSFLRAVCKYLDDHRLITTEVHVVPPQYCRICDLRVSVAAKPGFARSDLQNALEQRFGTYYHVLTGGDDGTGFPFGGQIHIADLMAQVYRLDGVARVEELTAQFTRTKSNASPREGQLVLCPTQADQVERITLAPEETVSAYVDSFTLTTVA
jgi:predicted phage baseplate assembly protein